MNDLNASEFATDSWSEWLTCRRHGGDPAYERIVRSEIEQIRDRVLSGAGLSSGMTMLDVGAGDGLISFAALERVKQPFCVIFSDISAPLLNRAEYIATNLGFAEYCTFLQSSAETLAGVADESVDVVTSRAVLAYVEDKRSAVRSFLRVLKPGGRVSLAEPVYQHAAVQLAALAKVLQSEPANANTPFLALLQRCRALQLPANLEDIRSTPVTNFSERELLQLFSTCGFTNIHMELHIDIKNSPAMPWSTFIEIAPRPGTPNLREIFEQHFTAEDISLLEKGMRKAVEDGTLTGQTTNVYLTAEKATPRESK